MATTIQGPGGSVTLPTGFGGKIDTWTANLEVTTVNTTGFSDNGYLAKAPTAYMMSGSASGTALTVTTPTKVTTFFASTLLLSDAKGTVTLVAQTGCQYTGTAILTSIKLTRPNAGKCDISFDFKFTGVVVPTWDETP